MMGAWRGDGGICVIANGCSIFMKDLRTRCTVYVGIEKESHMWLPDREQTSVMIFSRGFVSQIHYS